MGSFWGNSNRLDGSDGDMTVYILSRLIELCTYQGQILLCNLRTQTEKKKEKLPMDALNLDLHPPNTNHQFAREQGFVAHLMLN